MEDVFGLFGSVHALEIMSPENGNDFCLLGQMKNATTGSAAYLASYCVGISALNFNLYVQYTHRSGLRRAIERLAGSKLVAPTAATRM